MTKMMVMLMISVALIAGMMVMVTRATGGSASGSGAGDSIKNLANENAAAMQMRLLSAAQQTYSVAYPNIGYASSLAALGPGDVPPPKKDEPVCKEDEATSEHACIVADLMVAGPKCSGDEWCVKSGYKFHMSCASGATPCSEYLALALPVNGAGRSFCGINDAMVHVIPADAAKAPDQISVAECAVWPGI
jgi:hypothetical protein